VIADVQEKDRERLKWLHVHETWFLEKKVHDYNTVGGSNGV
jgi:hypothetical protein